MSKIVKGAGLVRVDHVLVSPKMVSGGSNQRLSRWSVQCSGGGANALAVVASLGLPTAFAGRVGDDFLGQYARDSFVQLGCEVSGLIAEKGKLTSSRYYLMSDSTPVPESANTNSRLTSSPRISSPSHAYSEIASLDMDMNSPSPMGNEVDADEWLSDASCLVLEAGLLPNCHELLRQALGKGLFVVLSGRGLNADSIAMLTEIIHDRRHHATTTDNPAVASGIGIVTSERTLSRVLSGKMSQERPCESSDATLDALAGIGFDWSVVTLGDEGAVGQCRGKRVATPAIQIPVVDCISAGDIFLGGFIYGSLKSRSFQDAMNIGHRVAAWSCEAVGARSALPTASQLQKAGYI